MENIFISGACGECELFKVERDRYNDDHPVCIIGCNDGWKAGPTCPGKGSYKLVKDD